MATFKKFQEALVKSPKVLVSSTLDFQKNVIYATLGVQKVAYEYGVDKFSSLSERAKSDVEGYIKRGEEVEETLVDKFDEFKNSENTVAKSIVSAESQLKELAGSTEEQYKKVTAQVTELTAKVTDTVKSRLNIADAKPVKRAAKKAAPKAKAKKAPAKKAAAKKAAAKKSVAKKAA